MKKLLGRCVLVLAGVLALVGLLLWGGVLHFNNPSPADYPVRGVDVSSYQGEIDWSVLAAQDLSFAFIKATEGSGSVDPCFAANFREAAKTDLRIGAYHFFSFDSPGETQAENFIAVVPRREGMLPPVVDFEFYGDKKRQPPDPAEAREQLDILLARLENYYGQKPILYATEESYAAYLDGFYEGHDLWIRSVLAPPKAPADRWTFWQYTSRQRLPGYDGDEWFIDCNVFRGDAAQFQRYGK